MNDSKINPEPYGNGRFILYKPIYYFLGYQRNTGKIFRIVYSAYDTINQQKCYVDAYNVYNTFLRHKRINRCKNRTSNSKRYVRQPIILNESYDENVNVIEKQSEEVCVMLIFAKEMHKNILNFMPIFNTFVTKHTVVPDDNEEKMVVFVPISVYNKVKDIFSYFSKAVTNNTIMAMSA